MPQNSEQIEAKLCAYLEGELDEQGRAEIEKHLQANPAHRKLLAEVAGTRDLLRGLPREPAPPDLCETFQGQLERSVLLGDTPEARADTSLRIGRWRPVLAMAAMVVLAVGLGLVIYFGLPSGTPRPGAYSVATGSPRDSKLKGQPTSGPAAVAQAAQSLEDRNSSGFAFRGESGVAAAVPADAVAATTAPAQAAAVPSVPENLPELAQRVPKLWSPNEQRELFAAAARRIDRAGAVPGAGGGAAGAGNSPVYFVLSTPEPAAARAELMQELDKLRLAWETVPTSTVLATRDEGGMSRSRGLDAAAGATRDAEALKNGTEAELKPTAAPRPPADPGAAGARPADASAASRSEATAAVAAPAAPAVSADSDVADKPTLAIPPATSPALGETLILARNVTLGQAEALRASLSARHPEQQVVVLSEPPAGATAPAKSELNAVVRRQAADATPTPESPAATLPPASAEVKEQVALRAANEPAVAPAPGRAGKPSTSAPSASDAPPAAAETRLPQGGASLGGARGMADAGRGRVADSGAAPSPQAAPENAVARAKDDADLPGYGRGLGRSRTTGRKEAPSGGLEIPKEGAAGGESAVKEGDIESGAPSPLAPSGAEAERMEPATQSATAGTRPAGPAADTLAENEQRFDLLIMVKSPESVAGPTGPIEKFEILTVTLGEGDETNVRVGEDGTIDLPKAGKVVAEGQTPEMLGKRIAESLGRANSGAKVTVVRPGSGPATTRPDETSDPLDTASTTGTEAKPPAATGPTSAPAPSRAPAHQ